MLKYGNARYLQIANPAGHWHQVDGLKEWECYYNGPFQLELLDLSATPPAFPVANRFTEGTLYFDVETVKSISKFDLE